MYRIAISIFLDKNHEASKRFISRSYSTNLWKFLFSTQTYLSLLVILTFSSQKLHLETFCGFLFTAIHNTLGTGNAQLTRSIFPTTIYVVDTIFNVYTCWQSVHDSARLPSLSQLAVSPPSYLSARRGRAGERFTLLLKILLAKVVVNFEKGNSVSTNSSRRIRAYVCYRTFGSLAFYFLLFLSSLKSKLWFVLVLRAVLYKVS